MEYYILRMLRCISNISTFFLKITFSQLGFRTFQHVATVHCCVRILTAHQQEDSLKDVLQMDDCASFSSQTKTCSDDAQKLRTVIPKRRADVYFFQTATPSIWNALPNKITSIFCRCILMSKIDEFYCLKF